jgi:hypothetical protein
MRDAEVDRTEGYQEHMRPRGAHDFIIARVAGSGFFRDDSIAMWLMRDRSRARLGQGQIDLVKAMLPALTALGRRHGRFVEMQAMQ